MHFTINDSLLRLIGSPVIAFHQHVRAAPLTCTNNTSNAMTPTQLVLYLTGEDAPTAGPLLDGGMSLSFPCPRRHWHESMKVFYYLSECEFLVYMAPKRVGGLARSLKSDCITRSPTAKNQGIDYSSTTVTNILLREVLATADYHCIEKEGARTTK